MFTKTLGQTLLALFSSSKWVFRNVFSLTFTLCLFLPTILHLHCCLTAMSVCLSTEQIDYMCILQSIHQILHYFMKKSLSVCYTSQTAHLLLVVFPSCCHLSKVVSSNCLQSIILCFMEVRKGFKVWNGNKVISFCFWVNSIPLKETY